MVKIVVAVKRVVDANVSIRVKTDRTGVDLANVKMAMNPFDEIAVEEAVRLREAGIAEEVIVVSIGPDQAQETIRSGLAMGADRGILVQTNDSLEPLAVAKILAKVIVEQQAQLALLGKQAIDDDANQTSQMLAAMLGWGQATFASRISIADGQVEVTREVDSGLQVLAGPLPAVISVDLRLNQPRYASLPNIMKAKKKPITVTPVADFGIDVAPRLTVLSTDAPTARKAGVILKDPAELVARLRDEAGVI
jgi:electron transfer flavoprotein beta subunit